MLANATARRCRRRRLAARISRCSRSDQLLGKTKHSRTALRQPPPRPPLTSRRLSPSCTYAPRYARHHRRPCLRRCSVASEFSPRVLHGYVVEAGQRHCAAPCSLGETSRGRERGGGVGGGVGWVGRGREEAPTGAPNQPHCTTQTMLRHRRAVGLCAESTHRRTKKFPLSPQLFSSDARVPRRRTAEC